MEYQVAVIGAGPGGYIAALRAAQFGLKVCVIEKDEIGGVCLNRGCIPTKALVSSAKAFAMINNAAEYGIELSGARPNWGKIIDRKDQVVKKLVNGINFLFNQHKVDLIRGEAALIANGQLEVTFSDGQKQLLNCEKIIIATGSSPQLPAFLKYDGKTVLNSDDVLTLPRLPESMLIIGGGVIGSEFASIFAALGVKVSIVEMMERLIPTLDSDLSATLRLQFKKRGIAVYTGTGVAALEKGADRVRVSLQDGKELTAEKVLVSIGRKPNSAGIGLEKAEVKVGVNGRILVNPDLETNIPGIYAIGDVNDQPYDLAHAASAQGVRAVEHLLKMASTTVQVMPSCIFTDPEVATVGLSTDEAETRGVAALTGKVHFLANGKAVSQGEGVGFIKVVAAAETRQLLGVHIIGPHASELIAEAALAVQQKLTVRQIAETIHAHPSLAEAFHQACEEIYIRKIMEDL